MLAASTDLVVVAPPVVHVIMALVIPIVVGLLTKITLPAAVKAIMLVVFNAVSAFLTTAMVSDGSAVFTKAAFVNMIFGIAVSVATYAGVYRPLDLTSSTPTGKLGPNSGIG